MEKNPSDGLSFYLLETDGANRDFLGQIRHWDNLKMATHGKTIYVRDFTPEQLKSVEVVTIPDKQVFEVKDNLLFPVGSLLPVRKFTASLLWTPMRRALSVELPELNHNLFEVETAVDVKLVASENPQEETGALISRAVFETYMNDAPLVRTAHLSWTILEDNILVLGKPLLPLPGISVWKSADFLLPSGFDLEFPDLGKILYKTLDPYAKDFILWLPDGRFANIPKDKLMPLNIGSWRKTFAL